MATVPSITCPNLRVRDESGFRSFCVSRQRERDRKFVDSPLRAQGDLAGALAADKEAVRIMSELTAKAPAQSLWQRDLAVSHGKVGLDLLAEGDASGAREEIEVGLPIMTGLAALDATNADWQQDLGELRRESGDAAKAASDRTGASAEYEACIEITEPIVSRGSTNKKLAELAAYCRSQITSVAPGPKPS